MESFVKLITVSATLKSATNTTTIKRLWSHLKSLSKTINSSNNHQDTPSNKEEQYLNTRRSKMIAKLYGSFEVANFTDDLIIINEKVIRHQISVYQMSQNPSCRPRKHSKAVQATVSLIPIRPNFSRLNVAHAPTSTIRPDRYILDKNIGHRNHRRQCIYKIHWYGFGVRDCGRERGYNIP